MFYGCKKLRKKPELNNDLEEIKIFNVYTNCDLLEQIENHKTIKENKKTRKNQDTRGVKQKSKKKFNKRKRKKNI